LSNESDVLKGKLGKLFKIYHTIDAKAISLTLQGQIIASVTASGKKDKLALLSHDSPFTGT
jgi:hypothetical protein